MFRSLAAHGIPFVRFSAGGYWPLEWYLYRTNRDAHFQRLDAVIHAAERAGIGLIPSLFWHPPTLSDLAGEPFQDWGHRESKTFALMQAYTREVIQRYRDSQAVWAWEFGNEFNLPADLPNAAEHRPPVVPHAGTPTTRSAHDELTHAAFRTALSGFAEEARRWDARRLLLSGNAFPRSSAWHQLHHQTWDLDSREQWTAMLLDDHPAPISCLSGRLYSADDLHQLPWAAAAARATHRPLFIGEFGVPGRLDDPALARFQEQLDALDTHEIPLAALWVVDFDGQAADWNVTEANARAPLLRLLEQRNRTWRAAQAAAAAPPLPKTP
ncbi:MAG: hypothetical protein IT580_10270 [Verrucomicrobiales bacterium]|nr:hypothetical protein [Verrucomicrobiales bacterium]